MRTQQERRNYYRKIAGTMTQEEILRSMPDDELRMNARKGGSGALLELQRRENVDRVAFSNKSNDIDVGV